MKGNLLASRARWIRENGGEAGLDELVEAVPEPGRRFLIEPPLPFAWYPFEPMLAIDREIIRSVMNGRVERMYDLGNAIARYDLSTIYKVLFKLGSPAFIIKRIGIVYGQYLRPGRAVSESSSPGAATVSLTDVRFPYYFCAHGISGWLHAAIELSGGRNVAVTQVDCVHRGAGECRFELRWAG